MLDETILQDLTGTVSYFFLVVLVCNIYILIRYLS